MLKLKKIAQENWLNNHEFFFNCEPWWFTEDEETFDDFEIPANPLHKSDKDFLTSHPRPERILSFIRRQRKKRRIIITKEFPSEDKSNEKIHRGKRINYRRQKSRVRQATHYKKDSELGFGKRSNGKKFGVPPTQDLFLFENETLFSLEITKLAKESSNNHLKLSEGIYLNLNSEGEIESALIRPKKAS